MQCQYLVQRILFSTKCFVSQIITIGRGVLGRATPPPHTLVGQLWVPRSPMTDSRGVGAKGTGNLSRAVWYRPRPARAAWGARGVLRSLLAGRGGGRWADLWSLWARPFQHQTRFRTFTQLLESEKLIQTEDFGGVVSCVGWKIPPGGDFRTCFSRPLRQLLATNMHRSLSCCIQTYAKRSSVNFWGSNVLRIWELTLMQQKNL